MTKQERRVIFKNVNVSDLLDAQRNKRVESKKRQKNKGSREVIYKVMTSSKYDKKKVV